MLDLLIIYALAFDIYRRRALDAYLRRLYFKLMTLRAKKEHDFIPWRAHFETSDDIRPDI
jgi:hypothetical protein